MVSGLLERIRCKYDAIPKRMRRYIALLLLLLAVLLSVPPIFSGGSYLSKLVKDDGVTFITLSVGQSNAALILGEGRAFMVDTGANAAEDTVIAALNYYGVTELDGIFLTHEDEDHAGGLDRVLRTRTVRRLILSEACYSAVMQSGARESINHSVTEKGTEIIYAKYGEALSFAPLSIEVLAPTETASGNDGSLVIRILYGETAAIFLGDIEEEGERALYLDILSKKKDVRSALLMVAHHGAATSSNAALIREISPKYAVISCGTDNAYGHPAAAVLERLSLIGAEVHRTDLEGTVVICSNGEEMTCEK